MNVPKEIATYLSSQGLGTLGVNVFYGAVPADTENGLVVRENPGQTPDPYIPTKSPTFQVMVRNVEYDAGNTVMQNIRAALHRLTNTTLSGTYYYYILAVSEGGHLGRDESGHDVFSMNFEVMTR